MHDFFSSGADQAGDTQNLASANGEGDIGERGSVRQLPNLKNWFTRSHRAFLEKVLNVSIDHQGNDRRHGALPRLNRRDVDAVAKDRNSVAQSLDLVQIMRNIDNR